MSDVPRTRSRYLVFTSEYLLPLVIVIFVSLVTYLCFFSPLLRIRTVSCLLDYSPCAEGVLTAELNRYKGKNLLLFDPAILKARLLEAQPTIGQVSVGKVLPSTLAVELYSVSPTYAIKQTGDSRYIVLDKEFRVIGLRELDPHLPFLEVALLPPVQIGSALTGLFLTALTAMSLTGEAFIPAENFTLRENVLEIKLEAGPVAVLSLTDELSPQISLLQALLRDPKILEGVTTVDVRYTQPILK